MDRKDYLHPITGLPLTTAQLAQMIGGQFDTAHRPAPSGKLTTDNDHNEAPDLCRQWWWGNAAGEVVSDRAVASALRKYHPEAAEVILSEQRKANQTRRQQTLREATSEADQKAKRRSYDRARRKRLKEAKIIKSREAEVRARQMREERRAAARQEAKATTSPSSSIIMTTIPTNVDGDQDHV